VRAVSPDRPRLNPKQQRHLPASLSERWKRKETLLAVKLAKSMATEQSVHVGAAETVDATDETGSSEMVPMGLSFIPLAPRWHKQGATMRTKTKPPSNLILWSFKRSWAKFSQNFYQVHSTKMISPPPGHPLLHQMPARATLLRHPKEYSWLSPKRPSCKKSWPNPASDPGAIWSR
jgi:hypothetical protein